MSNYGVLQKIFSGYVDLTDSAATSATVDILPTLHQVGGKYTELHVLLKGDLGLPNLSGTAFFVKGTEKTEGKKTETGDLHTH